MCMRCQQNPTITQTLPKSINSQLCNHTCPFKTPIEQISNLSHRQMLTIQIIHCTSKTTHSRHKANFLCLSISAAQHIISSLHRSLAVERLSLMILNHASSFFSFSLPLPPCQNYGWLTRRQRYRIPYVRHLFQEPNLAQQASQAA